jgi:hypothetical protein
VTDDANTEHDVGSANVGHIVVDTDHAMDFSQLPNLRSGLGVDRHHSTIANRPGAMEITQSANHPPNKSPTQPATRPSNTINRHALSAFAHWRFGSLAIRSAGVWITPSRPRSAGASAALVTRAGFHTGRPTAAYRVADGLGTAANDDGPTSATLAAADDPIDVVATDCGHLLVDCGL